jgi:hypothetical protein
MILFFYFYVEYLDTKAKLGLFLDKWLLLVLNWLLKSSIKGVEFSSMYFVNLIVMKWILHILNIEAFFDENILFDETF